MRRSASIVGLAVLLSLAACGDDSGGDETAPPSSTTTSVAADPGDDTGSDSTTGDDATTGDPSPEGPADVRAVLLAGGAAEISLRPADEGGPHPTLAWDAVDGAASYQLFVHDADGVPYWSWSGSDTSVRLGGGDRAELNQTAALHEPMTWNVVAFDADGAVVAVSVAADVAP